MTQRRIGIIVNIASALFILALMAAAVWARDWVMVAGLPIGAAIGYLWGRRRGHR